jgi:hypothetical protein
MCSSAVERDVIDGCAFSEEWHDENKSGVMILVIKWFDVWGQVTYIKQCSDEKILTPLAWMNKWFDLNSWPT